MGTPEEPYPEPPEGYDGERKVSDLGFLTDRIGELARIIGHITNEGLSSTPITVALWGLQSQLSIVIALIDMEVDQMSREGGDDDSESPGLPES
jgi:hypothetical protein